MSPLLDAPPPARIPRWTDALCQAGPELSGRLPSLLGYALAGVAGIYAGPHAHAATLAVLLVAGVVLTHVGIAWVAAWRRLRDEYAPASLYGRRTHDA